VYDTAAEETHSQAAKRRYTELQAHKTDLELVYEALQSRPETDAQAILGRIRRGDDVNVIARHINFGDLLIQVALEPETRYRYEFPMVRDIPAHLIGSWNPYLDSLIYEWTPAAVALDGSSPTTTNSSRSTGSLSPTTIETYAPYLKPYHAAEVISNQLNSVEPSRWTSVCSDNTLMRKLLGAYFLQEHGWYTCIQKDDFLEDMANMRNDSCSPLLVNALLAAACVRPTPCPLFSRSIHCMLSWLLPANLTRQHCYRPLTNRAQFWNPHTLSYRFLAEARRLWELELSEAKLTTILAGILINLVYNISGADKVGWSYTVQTVQKARAIGLFGAPTEAADERRQRGRDFAAWAVFCWQRQVHPRLDAARSLRTTPF